MEKGMLITILLIIGVVIIFGVAAYFIFASGGSSIESITNSECEKSDYPDDCYNLLAIEKKDQRYCVNIENEYTKEACFIPSAKNVKECEIPEIKSSEAKDACYMVIAINNNEISVCDKMSSTQAKELCYLGVNQGSQTIQDCKTQITDPELQNECIAQIAVDTNDITICNTQISDERWKERCIYAINNPK